MNKLIGLMVSLVVGVLLVGSLLAPIVSSMTPETRTYVNEGSYFTTPDDETHTYTFGEDAITYDDVEVDYPEPYGTGTDASATLFIGSDWICRCDQGMTRIVVGGPDNAWLILGTMADYTITATVTGDSFTINSTLESRTGTFSDLEYMIADTGDYVMAFNPYITEETPIVGAVRNNSNTASADIFEVVSGSLADGFSATTCKVAIYSADPTTGDVTSTFTADTTEIDGDLVQLDNIVQSLTFWDDSTATLYISYVVVPETIVYDNPDYIGALAAPVLSAVVVVLMVAFVTVAARGITRD